jgi:hypothetical protein
LEWLAQPITRQRCLNDAEPCAPWTKSMGTSAWLCKQQWFNLTLREYPWR